MRRVACVLVALLSGCTSSQQYTNFQQVVSVWGEPAIPKTMPPEDRSRAINCMTWATVKDIPPEDQKQMLDVMNGAPITREVDVLYYKWLGFHITQEPSKRHVDPGSTERIKENFQVDCPDLMEKYPQYFG